LISLQGIRGEFAPYRNTARRFGENRIGRLRGGEAFARNLGKRDCRRRVLSAREKRGEGACPFIPSEKRVDERGRGVRIIRKGKQVWVLSRKKKKKKE